VKRVRNFLPERASPERSRLRDTIIAALIAGVIMEAILSLLALVGLGIAVNELQAEALNGLRRLTPWALAEGYWDYIELKLRAMLEMGLFWTIMYVLLRLSGIRFIYVSLKRGLLHL
jgi:hypothetical protein